MKHIVLFLTALLLPLLCAAQADSTKVRKKKERQVELSGEVYDSFTKAKVRAFVTLMRAQDSTVVDTMTCWTWSTISYYNFKVPARQDDFIIKATAKGYEDTCLDYQLRHIARNNYFELPRLLMKKKQRSDDDIYKEVGIDGVVITGTKVKLAYRGDTLVYNASAFNLPEGSMLDGLIRQMPGAELKENGDIYINGRKVDYLTLNGKDFFKGQNKVMLDNLPYYTVKELKVYDKSTKQSELIGHDVEKKDYVMDVSLKREYNRGYMANAEMGGGTDDRYMARLFGLYYDDHSRVSLFGNANNINENRRPGNDGEWRPSDMPQGQRITKLTGLSIQTEDKDKRWEDNFDASFEWSDANDETRRATETFASDGNILGGYQSWSRQKDFRFSVNNYFAVQKPVIIWGQVALSYANGDRQNNSTDSTWHGSLINSSLNDGLSKYRTLNMSGYVGVLKKFDWGDHVALNFNFGYDHQKPNESFSLGRTYYPQADSTDLRHYYTDSHGDSYHYNIMANYVFQMLNKWYVSPFLSYSQSMNRSNNLNYRLDWLHEAVADDHQTDWLPSSREALMSVLDPNNHETQFRMTHGYSGGVELSHSDDKKYFSLRLPVSHNQERMDYSHGTLDTIARRHYTHFSPSINLYQWGIKRGLQNVSYGLDISEPDFAGLMPADNTTNPLARRINNPGLKARITHRAGLSFGLSNDSTRHFARLWTNASLTQRSWGTRTTYDQATGAYTYQTDNVNGNWFWSLGTSYELPLDKQKHLTLQQRADAEYTHSVDFDILYTATSLSSSPSPSSPSPSSPSPSFPVPYAATLSQPSPSPLSLSPSPSHHPTSTVNNWTLHERLGLEYQRDKLTATISGEVSWRSSTSDRQNFERISAFDYSYGATLRYTIPWVKLSLSTDLRMYSRRGYNSAMMNTDDLVWNTEFSRSLFKEKLIVKLTAFDLLHELSNKQYSVNAQGRTETWNNCIPCYVMLSLAYKFTQSPKKQ